EHAEVHRDGDRVRRGEGAVAEEAHRQHRRLRARLPPAEEADENDTPDDEAEHLPRSPAERIRAHNAPDDAEEAARAENEPFEVELPVRAAALAEVDPGERDGDRADRDVD